MHDTISTAETPQNENAASRSARHGTLDIVVYYIKSLKNQGLFFTSILGAEPSKKVMPP